VGVRPLAGGVLAGEEAEAWVYQIAEVHAHCCTAMGTVVLRGWRCRTGAQPRHEDASDL